MILTLVLNGLNLLNVDANWQPFVTGAIIIVAVLVDSVSRQRQEARA
jgi:ribose transport system permease protein